jgi:hypothetical protein
MKAQLIAPCGLDCSTCSRYLACLNALPKKQGSIPHCSGCRPRNKQCAFLKGHCELLRKNKVKFCFQCRDYPCARLRHLDERYRRNFGTSPIANLEEIRFKGIETFMRNQQNRYGCAACGAKVSVHDKKCYGCERMVRGNLSFAQA